MIPDEYDVVIRTLPSGQVVVDDQRGTMTPEDAQAVIRVTHPGVTYDFSVSVHRHVFSA